MENLVTYSILNSPLIAAIVAVVIYLIFGLLSEGKRPSLFWFVLGNFGLGILVMLTVAGNFCTLYPGNLCPPASVFFGLLAFSLTVLAYSCSWAWYCSRSSKEQKTLQNINIPVPEPCIKGLNCGAVISKADAICVWCGHKTEHRP